MADGLLTGFRALDLTDARGIVCGKIMATLGVDVIKVERPGGDLARNVPPFYQDIPDPHKSLYWLAFNTDKRSITLNLEVSKGQELFRKLVEKADFVLESYSPGYLDSLGLGYEALSQINPRIIMTSITHFGQKGPHSYYKGSELVDSAMSGVLGSCGYPDRPPVKEALDSCYFSANAAAALGTLISHYCREVTGEGQQVDVSIQEVAVSRYLNALEFWVWDKRLLKRSGHWNQIGAIAFRWIWPCKDGNIFWILMGGSFGAAGNRALSQWIDEDGIENPLRQVANWDELDMAAVTQETRSVWEAAIGKFFLNHTTKEIAEEGLKRGINACVVKNPADVFNEPHFNARSYWIELGYPELDVTLAYPKYFFLCSETENYVRCSATRIGQNNVEIYGRDLGLSSMEITALKRSNII